VSSVLVISPHPDDESIGCGGTLRKHVVDGDAVHVAFVTSGERGGPGRARDEVARQREAEAEAATRSLGITAIEFWREPDGGVRATERVVERFRRRAAALEPDLVYVPHFGEMHPDHRAAARLVRRAFGQAPAGRPAPARRPTILMYEVWTPLQRIDAVVDISPYVEAKRAAIRLHRSQCEVMRFDEASLALNRFRGEMHSWPGGDYAEIFAEMRP
jgi:N-acetylglucosamine malate deacetylase 1